MNLTPKRPLTLSIFIFGGLTLVFSAIGLYDYYSMAPGFDPSADDWGRFSNWLFQTAAVLLLDQPNPAPQHWAFSLGRVLGVFFASLSIAGILLELSLTANNYLCLLKFWLPRFNKNPEGPVLVIGLGYMGGHMVRECRERGNTVYAVCLSSKSERVKKASKMGVYVVVGNAMENAVRKKARMGSVRKIFIATGDDSLNVEIAAKLREDFRGSKKGEVICHVHVADSSLAEVFISKEVLNKQGPLEFRIYSNRDLAAYDLCVDMFLDRKRGFFANESKAGKDSRTTVVPSSKENFHVFIAGFDLTGQAVTNHIARLAHFSSLTRPRVTILGNDKDKENWERFIDRHPALAPKGLDLAKGDPSDEWEDKKFHPSDDFFRTKRLNKSAVEYAANAEFLSFNDGMDSHSLLKVLKERLPKDDKKTRFAVVVCRETENRSFQMALRIQERLFQHFYNDLVAVPIYAYLPTEYHLADLLDNQSGEGTEAQRGRFPIHAFAEKKSTVSYDRITQNDIRNEADTIKTAYEALSGNQYKHTDFNRSNFEAVIHSELKFEALGIRFVKQSDRSQLLANYLSAEVNAEFESTINGKGGKVSLSLEAFESLKPETQQRLALLQKVKESDELTKVYLQEKATALVTAFGNEVSNADLAAQMEHNRWMGERLASGWSYGERNNLLKKRETFVPWSKLKDKDKLYDRQQMPALILSKWEQGYVAILDQ